MQGTKPRSALAAAGLAVVVLGCSGALSPARRVQDASNELSDAVRFGRMDLAVGKVSPDERSEFSKRHAEWGTDIRILDSEVVAIKMRDKQHAEVAVAVSWQRNTESELRATQIAQTWADERGNWVLEHEKRAGGDFGLLGENVAVVRPRSGQDVQFRTITIQ
jgi:hypothetical protein